MNLKRTFGLTAAAVAFALLITGACSEDPNNFYESKMTIIAEAKRPASLAESEPELPRVYLNTNYTPTTGRVVAVNAGGDLQAALDKAKPGDVIELQAGAAF